MLLSGPGANQRALAHRIHAVCPVDALIHVRLPAPDTSRRETLARRAVRALAGYPLRRAWFTLMAHYERLYPHYPVAPLLEVDDVNDPAVVEKLEHVRPDLIVVSGTNLLRRPLIEAAAGQGARIMNLHTGISPYVRGGPNCTSWCLATGDFDLIGNTVMWIDAGIDSGNLVATERTGLTGSESLFELHLKVMEHAHALLIRCIRAFAEGRALPDVPQRELASGRLFLSRHWTATAAARAVANFYLRFRRGVARPGRALVLVSPEA